MKNTVVFVLSVSSENAIAGILLVPFEQCSSRQLQSEAVSDSHDTVLAAPFLHWNSCVGTFMPAEGERQTVFLACNSLALTITMEFTRPQPKHRAHEQ